MTESVLNYTLIYARKQWEKQTRNTGMSIHQS